MNRRESIIASITLLLGACAGATLAPVAATPGAPTKPSVLDAAAAPRARAPHGKAEIRHLARGDAAYLGLLRMDPSAAVPLHRDATEEYIYVLEGSGVMSIDGERFEVKANTAVFMPANAEVSFQNGDTTMVAVQVFAGPGPAAKYEAWEALAPAAP
jgi:mannose-6-phosphate isomerase-like protein (cupin superfamily)